MKKEDLNNPSVFFFFLEKKALSQKGTQKKRRWLIHRIDLTFHVSLIDLNNISVGKRDLSIHCIGDSARFIKIDSIWEMI